MKIFNLNKFEVRHAKYRLETKNIKQYNEYTNDVDREVVNNLIMFIPAFLVFYLITTCIFLLNPKYESRTIEDIVKTESHKTLSAVVFILMYVGIMASGSIKKLYYNMQRSKITNLISQLNAVAGDHIEYIKNDSKKLQLINNNNAKNQTDNFDKTLIIMMLIIFNSFDESNKKTIHNSQIPKEIKNLKQNEVYFSENQENQRTITLMINGKPINYQTTVDGNTLVIKKLGIKCIVVDEYFLVISDKAFTLKNVVVVDDNPKSLDNNNKVYYLFDNKALTTWLKTKKINPFTNIPNDASKNVDIETFIKNLPVRFFTNDDN